jgi:hypothetical protein
MNLDEMECCTGACVICHTRPTFSLIKVEGHTYRFCYDCILNLCKEFVEKYRHSTTEETPAESKGEK